MVHYKPVPSPIFTSCFSTSSTLSKPLVSLRREETVRTRRPMGAQQEQHPNNVMEMSLKLVFSVSSALMLTHTHLSDQNSWVLDKNRPQRSLTPGTEVTSNLRRAQKSKSKNRKQGIIYKEKQMKKWNLAISPKVLPVFNIFLTNPSSYVRK